MSPHKRGKGGVSWALSKTAAALGERKNLEMFLLSDSKRQHGGDEGNNAELQHTTGGVGTGGVGILGI